MIKITIIHLLAVFFTVLSATNLLSLELSTHYWGKAYDLKSNQLVYTEEYKEYSQDGVPQQATVTYFSPEGKMIAEKNITFKGMVAAPEFMMVDQRNGYIEGVKQQGDEFLITFQNDRESPLINKIIRPSHPVVIDAGFHYFILENWEALVAGKRLTFNFVVPSVQDFLQFEIKKRDDFAKTDNFDKVQFRTGVSNFLLKAFIDPILLTYDLKTRQLLEYEGISNVNDDMGKSHNVRIEMLYQNISTFRDSTNYLSNTLLNKGLL